MTFGKQPKPFTSATSLLLPLLLAGCTTAPAANPPTPIHPPCDGWGSFTYFESASPQDVRQCLEAGADLDDMYWGHLFHTAARFSPDPAVIAVLIEAGADVDARNADGGTPLHSAAAGNTHTDVIAALLEAGADPNARDLDGQTPLHMAAHTNDNPDIITALVQAGADPSARGPAGITPLHMAWNQRWPGIRPAAVRELLRLGADRLARNDLGQIADPVHCDHWTTITFAQLATPADFTRCLELGADVLAPDDQGNTPLHRATQNEDASVLAVLLDAGADLEARNQPGHTPLHSAVGNGNLAAMSALLAAGADTEADAGRFYGTPLTYAATRITGSVKERNEVTITLIEALLEAGADVNAVDERGDTPLLKALRFGFPGGSSTPRSDSIADAVADLALKLLAAGADPGARGGSGLTPLHEAAEYKPPVLVQALLDAGADPNVRNDNGNSALHGAARSGSVDVIQLLVEAGAEVNGRNQYGMSPLHSAVLSGGAFVITVRSPTVETGPWRQRAAALLESGADPNLPDANGDTPLHFATQVFDTALVSLLAGAGADVNTLNDGGETPLQVARNRANPAVARKLIDLGADPGVIEDTGGIDGPLCALDALMFVTLAPPETLRDCLAAGFPVNTPDWADRTPLVQLAGSGPTRTTPEKLALFLAAGADANARDRSGVTPLHLVAGERGERSSPGWDGNAGLTAATALLEAGADVDARDSQGETPLHKAARRESSDTTSMESLLLEAGADVNARTNDGQTPLHLAASFDHAPVIAVLLEAGAEVDARTNAGHTPLYLALRGGRRAAATALLEAGADPDARDADGRLVDPDSCERWGTETFFVFATADVVAGCMEAGADPGAIRPQPDPTVLPDGWIVRPRRPSTPLHVAAAVAQDPAVITSLVQAGADVDARDNADYTPLHRGRREWHGGRCADASGGRCRGGRAAPAVRTRFFQRPEYPAPQCRAEPGSGGCRGAARGGRGRDRTRSRR